MSVPANCVDCAFHDVLADPDPFDWFCDDDVKVVCRHPRGQEITVACRPYNIRNECETPNWCPLRGGRIVSAQRAEIFDAADDALLEAVRDELARRALGDLYDAFQAYDLANSSPEDGPASAWDWAMHLQDTEHPLWLDAMREAREMT